MNLGQAAVDKGDMAEGEKDFKNVVDSAPAAYASQAALALAQLYDIEGKTAEAEKLLDNLIKNPTITVSKDEAELALAKVNAKTDPARARKMLEALQTREEPPSARRRCPRWANSSAGTTEPGARAPRPS